METVVEKEKIVTRLKELIPEFDWIKDEGLKKATLDVWCEAMEAGGWTPEDLDEIPFTLLLDPCPASFLTHTRSVTTCAYLTGKALKTFYDEEKLSINLDHLVAGALLHDVGKLLEYTRKKNKVVKSENGKFLRHPFSGVAISFGKGIPDDVLHMIAMHSKEGNLGKRCPESVIIHHADFTNFEPFH